MAAEHDGYFGAWGGVLLVQEGGGVKDDAEGEFRVLFVGNGAWDEVPEALFGEDVGVAVVGIDDHYGEGGLV